jgi:hypothetical protein
MENKTILSIARDAEIITLFTDSAAADKSLNEKLAELATKLAKQVETLEQPFATRVALIEATYAAEFKTLSANRNTVATLRALIVAKVSADTKIEIKPPSKDGKTAAVFKTAADLTAGEAKKFAAEIKAAEAEAELTPEQVKEKEAAAAAAKKAEQEKYNAIATAAAKMKQEESFAFVLSKAARPELIKRLAAEGIRLVKNGRAPVIEETAAEDQEEI